MATDISKKLNIPYKKLYNACDISRFSFATTAELEKISEHVGQDRAMEALKFGMGMKHDGYNLYVLGSTGLGKHTTVKKILDEESSKGKTPSDWCYVNNFEHHHNPAVMQLPAGYARKLQRDMQQLIEDIIISIPAAFESDEYRTQINAISDEYKEREQDMFDDLSEKANQKNIVMLRTPGGYTLGPMKDGKILTPEEFDKLDEDEQEKIKKLINEVESELKQTLRQLPVLQKESRERVKEVNKEISQLTVSQFVEEVKSNYGELPDVLEFIDIVKKDIIENVDMFRRYGEEKQSSGNNNTSAVKTLFSQYQVNVLVDNSETEGAPIIYEDNPTYQNLLGRIEHVAQYGTLLTDFTLIKAGALHRANGGYLVLDARKILLSPFAYEGLKRALHSHEVRIESLEQMLSLASTTSLKPEPIPIDVKVVLTGGRLLYYLLKQYDPEFSLLFKVAADFSEDIERSYDNVNLYARLIATLQQENALLDIDKKGVARIIEHCARLAEDGEKISLHMGSLLDLLRESDYWARQAGHKKITRVDVQKVIDTRHYRLGQIRERMQEQVLRDIHLINTEGEKTGQINGLSVIQLGDYAFGRPVRITATARLGSGKVIDIEREVRLGGSIHSKGVLILSSYLANCYAKEQPLALSASIVFEQSYGMIEGDSASAAELCSLVSALAEKPINQGLAVTGSVNQYGEIQAIGGVNEKIEGFFDLCNARGLTGMQGAIIPRSNIKHLMLRSDVREAVKSKKFNVYAVSTVDEMISILTGVDAGKADKKGEYPQGTINYLAQKRMYKLTRLRKEFSHADKKEHHSLKRKHES
jgi:lon-related putative ATP-dependent protease